MLWIKPHAVSLICLLSLALCCSVAAPKEEQPFAGLRALVLEPENFWGWDSVIFGALQERGFDVTYAKAQVLEDFAALSRYDLVASNIKRDFTPAQIANLKKYIAEGGALYGSWGGPMGAPELLEICHVGQTKSVWIMELTLLGDTPLSAGIGERKLLFPQHVGHMQAENGGFEIVLAQPLEDGIPVAKDAAGNVLGVLGRHGKGRTAVLGFGPEKEKQFSDWKLGPLLTDNLLNWLLEEKLKSGQRTWSNRIYVSLPARAEVLTASLDGKEVKAEIRTVGSLKSICLDAGGVAEGATAALRVTYKPLAKARNVETMIHMPWTLSSAASSPAALAEYLKSLHATMVQPLLRSANGTALYKGLPQDTPDDQLVTYYQGNFLADLLGECQKREIKLIAGIYFSNAVAQREAEAAYLDKNGQQIKDGLMVQACFNNPKGQEYNLATVRQLFANYKIDGVILDDNFELDQNNCYCAYCKGEFRKYCEKKGVAYADPAGFSEGPLQDLWQEYQREATRQLAAKVTEIAHQYGKPAGGWVGASMKAARLAKSFDFLGGMVYTEPPRAIRLPLSVLGDCKFVCLLWAPDAPPEMMEHEAREAVHAGAAIVGFWTRNADERGYKIDDARTAAIRRAFAGVEKEWLDFYRANILSGDVRFTVTEGKAGQEELTLKVKNTGAKVDSRLQGELDLSALE